MYPWPTLYALPLSRRPGVFPTMVARLFSSAKAKSLARRSRCVFVYQQHDSTVESLLAEPANH